MVTTTIERPAVVRPLPVETVTVEDIKRDFAELAGRLNAEAAAAGDVGPTMAEALSWPLTGEEEAETEKELADGQESLVVAA